MFALIDTIADMLFAPESGVKKSTELGWGKITFFFAFSAMLLSFPELRKVFPYVGNSRLFIVLLFQVVLSFSLLCILSFIIAGIASMFYDKTVEVRKIVAGFTFSYTPFLLLPLLAKLPERVYNPTLFTAIFFVWMIYLLLKSIKNIYEVSAFSACAIIFIPIILFAMLNVIFLTYIAICLDIGFS